HIKELIFLLSDRFVNFKSSISCYMSLKNVTFIYFKWFIYMRGVANLTQVLDDWRFDILNQMRSLLQKDHQSLLPDYSRIQPLSEALDDLYKEFNALKSHLGELTEKFGPIETFIDELKKEKTTGAMSTTPVRRRIIKKKDPSS
uniref:Uncharacterized protein n=1 Tax=Electrophorus electricus TaxID=8005 RepID=A0A4W4GVS8_ELEEL